MYTVKSVVKLLDKWIVKNNWIGYDPYDVKGSELYLFLSRNKLAEKIINGLTRFTPILIRRLLGVRKEANAKAMSLFARGYIQLYYKSREPNYLRKTFYCLKWLEENYCKGYQNFCWGYPFNWKTRILIPKYTPNIVVTSTAGNAFIEAYELTKEEKYLRIAESVCRFFLNNLRIDNIDDERICFSYTPIDKFHVHNANLMAAALLLRVFSHTENTDFKKYAIKALNYSISDQNKDGSWDYFGPPDKLANHIDNYHTGFILESLLTAKKILKKEFNYDYNLNKGVEFYIKKLFLKNIIPKFTNKKIFPIDIHSCAQAIITFSELSKIKSEYKENAEKIADWTIRNMFNKKGYFYYRIYENFIDKTPYMRWGQAWMLRALSYLD
ncbi:MAG: hypothetical protein OdinLCB4_004790 [Candidatus Odinarchaeum yellowstonii]|uniref:Delta-aminolevulinic acid dehydratase n=1 Tax=Odinarchaeota yellowstonii (strain LCB_4) TaxID=1841599 RepID=A0AAF0D172_ODILC|nr:MAG: hypothetical protein OdinLCB4_004790 [Candidatus Odinarchaeum yellowstonii]